MWGSTQPRPASRVPETAQPSLTGWTTVARSPAVSGLISTQDSSSREAGVRSPRRTSSPVSWSMTVSSSPRSYRTRVVSLWSSGTGTPVTTGTPRVTFAVTCTLRSSRSPNASARDSGTDRSGSTARYSPARDSTADHAAARGRGRQRREPLRQPVHPGADLHGPAPAGLRGVGGDLVRGHPRRHRPCGRRDPGRVHRRQPRREVGIHPQARVDVEPGARLDHLVRARDRKVAGQHQVPRGREPLTQRGPERGLPTGQPLRHPRRETHLRGGHRVDVPDRVDPLPRTRLVHRRLDPSTPRPEHRDQTVRAVRDRLRLPGELERLHRTQPAPLRGDLTSHRRAPLTECRDAAAELPPVHASSYRTPVRHARSRPHLFASSRTISGRVHELTHSSIRVRGGVARVQAAGRRRRPRTAQSSSPGLSRCSGGRPRGR